MAKLVLDGPLTSKGYEQITALDTVKQLTVPTGAWMAIIQAEDQKVRWRADGTDPTDAIGMVLITEEELVLAGATMLAALRFLEEAASAKLNVEYFGG